jgi:hypothetical protein
MTKRTIGYESPYQARNVRNWLPARSYNALGGTRLTIRPSGVTSEMTKNLISDS